MITTVNMIEIVTRMIDRGAGADDAEQALAALRLTPVPIDTAIASIAARLRATTRQAGLSLGDRVCIALAQSLNMPAVTADRAWARLDLGIEIRLVR